MARTCPKTAAKAVPTPQQAVSTTCVVHKELEFVRVPTRYDHKISMGQFKGNRHVQFEGDPMANLWLKVADKAGAKIEKFGNATGSLDI